MGGGGERAAPPTFYTTPGREPPEIIGRAFCEGSGGTFLDSRIINGNGPAAFYGVSKYTVGIVRTMAAKGRDYYYIDNGYFRPGHYDGYYRVTRNAAQHDGSGRNGPDRWENLGIELKPWRKDGRHILVACQSRTYFDLRGMRAQTWLWDVLSEINRVTDRPIIVRPKPTARTQSRPLADDFEGAWCVVTQTSNVAVEAIVNGIPAVTTGQCAATSMATAMEAIEAPNQPERDQWAWNLAANQWTLDEMRDGRCWEVMHAHR